MMRARRTGQACRWEDLQPMLYQWQAPERQPTPLEPPLPGVGAVGTPSDARLAGSTSEPWPEAHSGRSSAPRQKTAHISQSTGCSNKLSLSTKGEH